ncbi:MAG: hypothetical protein HWE37_15220 [Rhodobacteraceae bacterium]|nr:hypothetical protein [Paracoccaceae bacterium]
MTKRLSAALAALILTAAAAEAATGHDSSHDSSGHAPAPAAHGSADPHGATPAGKGGTCQGFGPQTPRDISNPYGRNSSRFVYAPPSDELNLCNIHTHTNAEHMGPGFSIYAGSGENGGFRCAGSSNLSPAELSRPHHGGRVFEGVEPGDTIEVHWVYSSCNVAPGPGLGSCLSDACKNPQLRVESQVFLVVNDPTALDFRDFIWFGTMRNGVYQPRALPTGTGSPVQFRGSTTGPSYTQEVCSPLQVTWSVRPRCARLDISSLDSWAAMGNVFEESHSHGVRQLVTAPDLLAPID